MPWIFAPGQSQLVDVKHSLILQSSDVIFSKSCCQPHPKVFVTSAKKRHFYIFIYVLSCLLIAIPALDKLPQI